MEYYFDTPQYVVPQMQGLSGTRQHKEPALVIKGVKLDSYGRYASDLGCAGCKSGVGDGEVTAGFMLGGLIFNTLMLGLSVYGGYTLYQKLK